jgi:hypothetical protein
MSIKFTDILNENILTEGLKIQKFTAPSEMDNLKVLLSNMNRKQIKYIVLDKYITPQAVMSIMSFFKNNKTDTFFYNDEWKDILISTGKI